MSETGRIKPGKRDNLAGMSFNPKEPQGTPRILKIHPNQSFINCKLVYMHFSLDLNIIFNNLNLIDVGGRGVSSQTEEII